MSEIIKCWIFKSSSGTKRYQTLLYIDGATSCDCPGWTKRCVGGVRTCKHVRLVAMGTHYADQEAESWSELQKVPSALRLGMVIYPEQKYPEQQEQETTLRNFDL